MAEEKVKLTFEADVAKFKQTVQQIPGITQKEVDKMVGNYTKGLKKIENATNNTAKGAKKLAAALGFGDKVEKVSNLAESIGLIGPACLAAGAGLAAIGAEVFAIYGAAKAVAQFAEWVSDATAETEKLARPLALISGMEIISEDSIRAAAAYNANLATLSTTSSGFAQILVDEFSPAMEEASAVATGLVVEYVQLAKTVQTLADSFASAHPIITDAYSELAAAAVIGGTAASLFELANSTKDLTGQWTALGETGRAATAAIEDDAAALMAWEDAKKRHDAADEKLLDHTKKINEEIGKKQVDALKASEAEWDKHVDVINKMIEAGYADRVRKETQATYEAIDAEIARTKAINDMIDAGMAAASEEKFKLEQESAAKSIALATEGAATMAGIQQAAFDQMMALGDQLAAQQQAKHEEEIANIDALMAKRQESLQQAIKNGNIERADDIRGRLEADAKRRAIEVKQAKRAYAASQAIAVMGIAISTAQATMALLASPAIADLGPAAPAVAAGLAIGTGAASAAAVLAAPAPKFHAGRAPDEQTATLTSQEAVMNPRAVARLGGPQAINALNAGASVGGGSGPVYLAIGTRQAEQIVQDGIGSGAVTMRLNKPDPLGAGRYGGR